MRAFRFRGLTCSFVCVSRSCLLLPSHWLDGQSLICPRAVGESCRLCPGVVQRWGGYVAGRVISAIGAPGDTQLLELPESLARVATSLDLAVLQGSAFMTKSLGVIVNATRPAERRPWVAKRREVVALKFVVEDSELIDAVARLYRLPLDPEGSRTCLTARAGRAILARHDVALRGLASSI